MSAHARRLRMDQLSALPALALGALAAALFRAGHRLLVAVDDAENVPMEGDEE